MRIDRLRLVNFGPHEDRTFEFSPGLNAIVGPNGSGKSSALEALHGALTGQFRLPGVKDDNIRIGAGPNARSRIEVELHHDNHKVVIERHLSPLKRKITIDGVESDRSEKAFQDSLEGLLGLPADILSNHIFIPQWGIFDLLDMTESKRDDLWAKLLRLDRLVGTYRALNDRLIRTPPQVQDPGPWRNRVNELSASLSQCPDVSNPPPNPDQDAELLGLLARARAAETQRLSWDKISQENDQAFGQLETATQNFSNLKQKLDCATETIGSNQRSFEAAAGALKLWHGRSIGSSRLSFLAYQRSESVEQLESCTARPLPVEPPPLPINHAEQLSLLRGKLSGMEVFLRGFNPETNSLCPTCGQQALHLINTWNLYRESLESVRHELASLERQLEARAPYDRERVTRDEAIRHMKAKIGHIDREISSINMPDEPSISEQDAASILQYRDTLSNHYHSCQQEFLRAEGALAVARQRWETAKGNKDKACAVLERDPGRTSESLEAELATRQRLRAEYAYALGKRQEIENSLAQAREALRQAEASAAESSREMSWRSRLRPLHAVLARDDLPRLVSREGLTRLTREANGALEEFSAPFRLEIGDGLEIMAEFNDGRKISAARLSGGQKVVAALAVRLANILHFAPGIGLLALDEPTAGLSKSSLSVIEHALERLRRRSRSDGLQVMFITHDTELSHLFDRVIELQQLP